MSIDIKHLSHGLFLATGEVLTKSEVEHLAYLLRVKEEVLPYIVLNREGFKGSPAVKAAIETAADTMPGRASSRRTPAMTQALLKANARSELNAALSSVMEREMADQTAQFRFDDALIALSNASPQTSVDLHLRIRRS